MEGEALNPMHKLILPFLALAGLFHAPSDPYTRMVEKTEQSIVRISGEIDRMTEFGPQHGIYTCTGEVIAIGKVLTAAHCIGSNMKSDQDLVSGVLSADVNLDLAVLSVDTHQRPALHLRKAPVVRFEALTAIGYAYGYTRLSALSEIVFLLHDAPWTTDEVIPPGIIVQGGYIGGMSGGPVVDAKGLQVSIVQRGDEFIGYGVDAATISAFLAAR